MLLAANTGLLLVSDQLGNVSLVISSPSIVRFTIDLLAFGMAFVFASLVEYWVHRLMHKPYKLGEKHRDHHRRNEGQGVIWEFRDYVLGSALAMMPPFFWSIEVGLFWAAGAIFLPHSQPTPISSSTKIPASASG